MLSELRKLVSRRHSFLLYGSAGAGKTLLLRRLMNEIPELLYCGDSSRSQLVFRTLAAALLAIKNCHVLRGCKPNAIHEKSAVSIRGIVIEALREARYWIVLITCNLRRNHLLPRLKMCAVGRDPSDRRCPLRAHGGCWLSVAHVF
jgi:Flp pilus assembly CpaF family ATPase